MNKAYTCRWGDNDHYIGPFTFAVDRRYRSFTIVLSSGDDDDRLAQQVGLIKHWRIIEGDYRCAPGTTATWFIDPPYADQGKQYPKQVQDFAALARWCQDRQGQVMVCESEGAKWLPFQPITTVAGATHRITTEVLWRNTA